jgi:peptidoglycan hydrolase CwlO-like protein
MDCYFRSDSNISMDSTQGLSVEESEIDEVAIARNIVAMRKQLQLTEKERAAKMQQIEKLNQEIADLDQSIVAIKEQLQPLRHFFPASAA